MQAFKKILVYVTTDSGHALKRAADLAKTTGATLKLVDVLEEPPTWMRALAPGKSKLPRLIAADEKERLEKLAERIRREGVKVETKVLQGKARPVEIVQEVLRHHHDLVMKTAETERGSKFFGATDLHLLRKCPCPVWLVKPRRAGRRFGILAAVAPSPEGGETRIPNTAIMETALTLSQLEGCDLHVIRAWRAYGESALRQKAKVHQEVLGDYLSATREKLNASLKTFLAKFNARINRKRVHLLKGHPGVVIPEFVRKRPMDILVMGTGVRSGVTGVLIGSTTEKIISQVDCSIFAVKPQGFVSPVKSS